MSKWKPVAPPVKPETTQESQNAAIAQNGVSEPVSEAEFAGPAEVKPDSTGPVQPAAASAPPAVADNPNPALNLASVLASLTPDQLQKIRGMAVAEGVTAPQSSGKRADGSMVVSVELDTPTVEQLELWAEADGCSLVEEAQKRIAEALNSYLYGDWSVVEQPAPAATNTTGA